MLDIVGSILIERPPEVVFDYLADQRNEVEYNPEMIRSEKMTNGPIGVGTRFAATVKSRGRPTDMLIEGTEFDRPARFGTRTSMSSADIEGVLTLARQGAGTRMSWAWQLRPKGALKVLRPLMAVMGRRQEQRIWAAMKEKLETSSATPAEKGGEE